MPSNQANPAYLALYVVLDVVIDTETGLYHGAVYRNHPYPSGGDRWLLSLTINQGFNTAREAAISANNTFPEIKQLDIEAYSFAQRAHEL